MFIQGIQGGYWHAWVCVLMAGRGVDLNRNWSVDWGKKEKVGIYLWFPLEHLTRIWYCLLDELWVLWDHTSVGEGNEVFLIRVCKPIPIRHVLKPWGKAQRGQYLLVVGLGCYKWYQSQTPSCVPARTLGPRGGELWDPTLVGEGNEALFNWFLSGCMVVVILSSVQDFSGPSFLL